MAGVAGIRLRIERRLRRRAGSPSACPRARSWWRSSLGAVVLLATGHNPLALLPAALRSAFVGQDSISETLDRGDAAPVQGPAAAVAFRMSLCNVGAEGQLYCGAIGASGVGLWFAGAPAPVLIASMAVAGMLAGAAWA